MNALRVVKMVNTPHDFTKKHSWKLMNKWKCISSIWFQKNTFHIPTRYRCSVSTEDNRIKWQRQKGFMIFNAIKLYILLNFCIKLERLVYSRGKLYYIRSINVIQSEAQSQTELCVKCVVIISWNTPVNSNKMFGKRNKTGNNTFWLHCIWFDMIRWKLCVVFVSFIKYA